MYIFYLPTHTCERKWVFRLSTGNSTSESRAWPIQICDDPREVYLGHTHAATFMQRKFFLVVYSRISDMTQRTYKTLAWRITKSRLSKFLIWLWNDRVTKWNRIRAFDSDAFSIYIILLSIILRVLCIPFTIRSDVNS